MSEKKTEKPKNPIRYQELYKFEDIHQMERDLYKGEICFGSWPNTRPIGPIDDVRICFKDKDDNVYSYAVYQHHGVLKDTKENRDAIQKSETSSLPESEQASSGEKVREAPIIMSSHEKQ